MNEQGKLSSVSTLLKQSWQQYRENINVVVPIMLIAGIGLYLLSILTIMYPVEPYVAGAQTTNFTGIAGIYTLIATFIYAIGMIWGIAALLNKITKLDQPMDIKTAFMTATPLIWPLIITGFLSVLATVIGFILLIIPGIIIGVWFTFAVYVVATEHKSGVEALKASKAYVKGYWWAVFGRSLVIGIVIGIIGAIIGAIISAFSRSAGTLIQDVISLSLVPLAMIFQYHLFQELRAIKSGVAPVMPAEPVIPEVPTQTIA